MTGGERPNGDGPLDVRRQFPGVDHDGVDFMEHPLEPWCEFPANGGQFHHPGTAIEQADPIVSPADGSARSMPAGEVQEPGRPREVAEMRDGDEGLKMAQIEIHN